MNNNDNNYSISKTVYIQNWKKLDYLFPTQQGEPDIYNNKKFVLKYWYE